jgi:hypothetical protein
MQRALDDLPQILVLRLSAFITVAELPSIIEGAVAERNALVL